MDERELVDMLEGEGLSKRLSKEIADELRKNYHTEEVVDTDMLKEAIKEDLDILVPELTSVIVGE